MITLERRLESLHIEFHMWMKSRLGVECFRQKQEQNVQKKSWNQNKVVFLARKILKMENPNDLLNH